MAEDKGFLNAWLKDAYSMEMGLVPILENHAKDAKDFPDMADVIQQHADRTKQHADMVKQCLERMGDSPSSLKAGLGSIAGSMQSVATGAAQDELVKNGLSDFAAENFEIACYKALIKAAEHYNDMQTVEVCREILQDEQRMAQWLDQQLPMLVEQAEMQKDGGTTGSSDTGNPGYANRTARTGSGYPPSEYPSSGTGGSGSSGF